MLSFIGGEEVYCEDGVLADVGEGVGVVLEGDGDETWVEGDLHHPVGHHAVDLVAVGLFGADDVEAVRHLVHHAGDGVFGDHELLVEPTPERQDVDVDAGLDEDIGGPVRYQFSYLDACPQSRRIRRDRTLCEPLTVELEFSVWEPEAESGPSTLQRNPRPSVSVYFELPLALTLSVFRSRS